MNVVTDTSKLFEAERCVHHLVRSNFRITEMQISLTWRRCRGTIKMPASRWVATEPHRSVGQSLIGETWEREL
jgi:hypothetical protein